MTPPYDVINEAERAAYMARSPYNMIHLIWGGVCRRYGGEQSVYTGGAVAARVATSERPRPRAPASALSLPARIFRAWCACHPPASLAACGWRRILWRYCAARTDVCWSKGRFVAPVECLSSQFEPYFCRLCGCNAHPRHALCADPGHSPQREVQHWMEGQHRLWVVTDPATIAQLARYAGYTVGDCGWASSL